MMKVSLGLGGVAAAAVAVPVVGALVAPMLEDKPEVWRSVGTRFDTKPVTNFVSYHNPQLERGAMLFYKKGCQYCHMINGEGGIKGPDLSVIGRTWTPGQLDVQIVDGGGNMPAYGGSLKQDELRAIVAFLSVQK